MRKEISAIIEGSINLSEAKSIKSKRSSEVLELMDQISMVFNRSGVNDATIEKILLNYGASEDDSGEEGFFTGMSDANIKKCWFAIQKELQNQMNKGREMDSQITREYKLVNKMTKQEFNKKYSKIRAKDNEYSDGYCDAVDDIVAAYNIKIV